jgi:hypothetical protein
MRSWIQRLEGYAVQVTESKYSYYPDICEIIFRGTGTENERTSGKES